MPRGEHGPRLQRYVPRCAKALEGQISISACGLKKDPLAPRAVHYGATLPREHQFSGTSYKCFVLYLLVFYLSERVKFYMGSGIFRAVVIRQQSYSAHTRPGKLVAVKHLKVLCGTKLTQF